MRQRFLEATFLQFSGIVGSGIFVLPYLFHRSNFIFASTIFLFLTVVTILLNRFYADIILATKGDHQLAGYAGKYLNSRSRSLAIINLLLLSLGASIAYQKLFVRFVSIIFPAIPSFFGFLLYIFLLVLFLIAGYRLGRRLTLFLGTFVLVFPLLLLMLSFSFPRVDFTSNLPNFAFYGGALFALSGFTIIPEVEELLRPVPGSKQLLYRSSLLGTILAAVTMWLFSYSIVVISGGVPSADSLSGLASAFPFLAVVIALFGLIVLFRASLSFLIILKEIFYRDLCLTKSVSGMLPLLFPIASYFLFNISFVSAISLTGDITIFISALLICLIRLRLSKDFSTVFAFLLILVTLIIGLFAAFVL